MSIQFFYNICLKDVDKTDLSGDLLSGVRRTYFQDFAKIKDRITGSSDAQPFYYDFSIEKDKQLKWLVKNASGETLQEVLPSDNEKYYIYFYEAKALYKRLLFSKRHTLLKVEYFDPAGTVRYTLEPRKAQTGLCILMTQKNLAQPIPLFDEPQLSDAGLAARMREEFDDYTVIATTNEGIVRFLSEKQLAAFNSLKEQIETELASIGEETFVGDETPLLDKINAKDFNVKRNLSSALDITLAMEFGARGDGEESPAEAELPTEKSAEASEQDTAETADEIASAAVREIAAQAAQAPAAVIPDDTVEEADEPASEASRDAAPDKKIMADGAEYSYYGELDAQGNRTGYGRTMTELGRTAYEGWYYNDKRQGNGSYFYKNGSLCYTGDWYENARHGVGVGVSSRDGSLHAGNWKNNKPIGNGVRLAPGGEKVGS